MIVHILIVHMCDVSNDGSEQQNNHVVRDNTGSDFLTLKNCAMFTLVMI